MNNSLFQSKTEEEDEKHNNEHNRGTIIVHTDQSM